MLKKSTKDWASMVAEEMMTRREGRTRRILGGRGRVSERREGKSGTAHFLSTPRRRSV